MAAVSAATAEAPTPRGFILNDPTRPPAIPAPTSAASGSANAKKSPELIPGGLIKVGLLSFNGSLKSNLFVLGSTLTL